MMKQKLLNTRRWQQRVLLVMVVSLLTHFQSMAQTFPSGFSRVQVVNTGTTVTNMDFAPDGRIFINHQDGRIRMYKNGVLSTLITLANVRNGGEDGLSGIVLDPNFSTNGYMYVYYTMTSMVNRLARLTLSGDAVVAQKTLIDIPLLSTTSQRHNGGALRFKDGYLYVTVGENDVNSAAQNKDNYNGKVLRINSADGSPVVGNPYYNDAGANTARKSIWSMGERNPWAMDISPSSKKVFVCNVGQTIAEEINDVTTAGTNSGYPVVNSNMEGNSTNPAYKNPIYYYTNPNYTPASTTEGCAITGGAFMESAATNYPATYVGKFFFTDWCNNWINYIDPSTGTRTTFATGVGAASPNASTLALRVGIDGNLYYSQNGVIYKIVYTNNSIPVFTNQPVSQTVIAGQSVTFSVNVSGATPMSFQWKKNGVNIAGATSSTYTKANVATSDAGSYTVTATNAAGSATSTAATLTVQPYNAPPVPSIVTPASGTTYYAGKTITFSGTATDAEDGSLPASAFRWDLDFNHNEHFHDLQTGGYALGTKSGSFTTATEGERETTVWYRLILTVTDSNGLTGSTYIDVLPQLSTISFATQPVGLQILLNGSPQTTPYSTDGVEGIINEMNVVQYQTLNGINYQFDHWVHGGTMDQTFAIPTNNTTYTAVFVQSTALVTTLTANKDAYVKDGANAGTNYGATDPTKIETKLDVTANSGYNREGYLGFDLSTINGTINAAQIKVYGNLGDASTIPVAMYSSTNTTWAETTINWNNKPAPSATALAITNVTGTTGQYYLWDVTSYIQSEKAAGRNFVTFNMKNMTTSSPQSIWSSKEGANAPQLVINYTPNTSNAVPSVTITAPTSGTSVVSGAAINFTVNATDTDGTVTSVSYYDGATLLGTSTTSPFSFSWTNASVGSHSVTAKATDNGGAVSPASAAVSITVTSTGDPLTLSYFHIIDKYTADYLRPKDGLATSLIVQDAEATVPTLSSFQFEFRTAPTTGYYHIVNRYTGLAIQPTNAATADGATLSQVALTTSNAGNAELQWAIEPVTGDAGYYWIKNKISGMYIRPAGGSLTDLTNIVQNPLNTTYSSFRWSLTSQGLKSGRSATLAVESANTNATVVYPNPTKGIITVVTEVEIRSNVSISIYHVSGKEYLSKEYQDVKGHFEKSFDLSGYPHGEFILKIQKGDIIESNKIIKN